MVIKSGKVKLRGRRVQISALFQTTELFCLILLSIEKCYFAHAQHLSESRRPNIYLLHVFLVVIKSIRLE